MSSTKVSDGIIQLHSSEKPTCSPKVGFLGVGWIGRHRLDAIQRSGHITVAAIADPSHEMAEQAGKLAPQAAIYSSLDELLRADLDGIVIASPSALHADQAVAVLDAGVAVFCQKPLARTAEETRRVVDAARKADRLLGVDLSYRSIRGMEQVRELALAGELGEIYAANLVFHNAYGPDKSWFYNPQLSGGGCVIDLGIHLVDLALWMLDFPKVEGVSSSLFAGGRPLNGRTDVVEDYALATLNLSSGAAVQLACSWRLQAGYDAVIEASFYGTQGGAALRNINGSFYDFRVERYRGTSRETLAQPPDDWGGRAAVAWAGQLAEGTRYDPSIEHMSDVAAALDRIYGR